MKNLYLLCGCPGSGKSTYVKKHIDKNSIHISRDEIRFSMINSKKDYFSKENEVFREFISNINVAIAKENIENIYVDATHLNEKSRNKTLDRLNLKEVNIIPINFIVPLDICHKRNKKRTGLALVPDNVVEKMFYQYEPADYNEKYEYKEIINIE